MSPANRCPPSSPAAFWHHSAVLPAPYSFLLPRPVGQQGLLANDAYVLPLRHWPGLARAPSPGRSWPCCCCFPPAAPWPWEVGRGPGRPCPQLPGWEAGSARPAWSCLPRQSHPVRFPPARWAPASLASQPFLPAGLCMRRRAGSSERLSPIPLLPSLLRGLSQPVVSVFVDCVWW